jgi:hypothetical protein
MKCSACDGRGLTYGSVEYGGKQVTTMYRCVPCGGKGNVAPPAPQYRAGTAIIELSYQDFKRAAVVGIHRNWEDHEHGLKSGGGFKMRDGWAWEQHILGAAGELAFANFMNVEWAPAKMKAKDVDGWQVRTVARDDGQLVVREKDKVEDRFVLMTAYAYNKFRVAGWLSGAYARQYGEKKNPNGWGEAWFVNQEKLVPFQLEEVR